MIYILLIILPFVVAMYMMIDYLIAKRYLASLIFLLPVGVAASFIMFTPYLYDTIFMLIDSIEIEVI